MSIQDVASKIVREELQKMIKEAKEKSPDVAAKLESLRKKLIPEMSKTESLNAAAAHARPERRIEITTVAELLDMPVNELMLHFLNDVKTKNDRSLVEFRLQHVYFYGE